MTTPARQVWQLAEPYHAVTYFAPEAHAAFERAGLRGFWRGYFAGRAAPLGPVGAGVVTASFFGFQPAFVARALPSIWSMVTPAVAIEARLAGVDDALRPIIGEDLPITGPRDAAALCRRALEACDPAGRPLFAANLELDWPTEPHLAMWHATTLLREHRGDGHVAALTVAGIDPCEAHVTQIAASGASPDTIQPYRGWNDDDWAAATERLRARGWLDDEGRLTADGRAGRERVEHDTDRLAAEPVDRLGDEGLETVAGVLAPLTARLVDTGLIPYPNPIGVPAPERR
ncbi:MAG: SCO6745 family protein [Acidimicrobiia bacterium]